MDDIETRGAKAALSIAGYLLLWSLASVGVVFLMFVFTGRL